MLISMKQVAGVNYCSTKLYGSSRTFQMSISMRYLDTSGEEMKTHPMTFVKIAHAAIGYMPDTTQGLVYRSVDFSKQGPNRRIIQVLGNQDAWRRLRENMLIVSLQINLQAQRGFTRTKRRRCSVPNHYSQVGKATSNMRKQESLITPSYFE